jgi:hypothetical protein
MQKRVQNTTKRVRVVNKADLVETILIEIMGA